MKTPVIVVGAGWAGLSAAYFLTQRGIPVTLLEAAPQAGGRARSVPFSNTTVDNGQHIFLGAYREMLNLLENIGVSEASVFQREPLRLTLQSATSALDVKLNTISPPFNLILAFIAAKGLSHADRLAALRLCRGLHARQFTLEKDISVQALLQSYRQSDALVTQLWAPLTLAALSTPIDIASAQVFLNVLKSAFSQDQKNSNILFPKLDLSQILPDPMINFLQKRGSTILYHQRVQELLIQNDRCVGVRTAEKEWLCPNIIVATAPEAALKLLAPHATHPLLAKLTEQLSHFTYQPITTVYFCFEKPINLPHAMMGLVSQTGHWIFDRAFASQPNIASIVISGSGPHSTLTQEQLITHILTELKQLFPNQNLGSPIHTKVICEKFAAFSCEVNIEANRPAHQTAIKGLWLAGDYTQTGYPATLEGAVQSGIHAAQLIVHSQSLAIAESLS